MQRSISNQKPLNLLLYIVVFTLYSSLSSIYLFLPPLLSVLFVLFAKALDRKDTLYLIAVSSLFVIFEANFGYILFSTIIYFYIIHQFIMPRITQNFSCSICIKISYVLFSYLGYFLFLVLISNIFLLEFPDINYYIVYYIVIEFFLVAIL